jgi:peptidoglycan hydrolase-like protein with peptidoglycan-binding domain
MSKLVKSKLFLAALVLVAVGAVHSVASAAITSTLKVGSTGAQVTELQTALGVTPATGYFGTKTKAAVIAFQTSKGLTADGIFGAKSLAAWTASGSTAMMTYPAGCTSATGFSTTTGASCTVTYPAGCTSNVGFSSTTGVACTSGSSSTMVLPAGCASASGFSSTTGVACTSGMTVNPTGSGNISADSNLGGFTNTIVGTGDTNHQVAGFTLTGAGGGSNVTLSSLTLSFNAAPFSGACFSGTDCGSSRFNDYFSAVSIWEGSTQIGSVPATAFSANSVNGLNNYVYSASVPLTGASVKSGQVSNFYIAITANSSLDTGNFTSGNKWAVQVGNIRYTDGTGVTLVYNPNQSFNPIWSTGVASLNGAFHNSNDPTFSFGSAATANNIILNIGRASSDQNAHTVTVNATGGSTQKVPLLAMSLTTQGGIPISVNKLPVVLTASAGTVDQYTTEVYLMNGTTVLDSESIPTGSASPYTVSFKINSGSPFILQPGIQSTLTVAADINSVSGGAYAAGASLTAATPIGSTSYDLSYGSPTGTELISSTNATTLVPGTANGQAVAFYATGASVNVTSESCVSTAGVYNGTNGGNSYLTCTIAYSVTANGAPVYIPQAAGFTANGTSSVGFTATVSSAPNTPIVSGASPAIGLTGSIVQVGTNATASQTNTEWTINAGVTANFTATIVVSDPTSVHPGQYRAYLVSVPWSSTSTPGPWANVYNFNLGAVNTATPGYTQVN